MPSPVDVSIVVATRNRAPLIGSCIAALAAQRTDARLEIVVVDNGSQDATGDVAREWGRRDPRVRLVEEPAVGLSRAKNAGIAAARGELLLFTDDDVVLPDLWVQAYVAFFARTAARPILAGGPVLPVAHDLRPWPAWISPGGTAELPRLYHGGELRRLGEFEWLWGANMAARRRLLDAVGGFDESIGYAGLQRGTFEDVDLVLRVGAHGGECWYLPAAALEHRTAQAATRPRALAGKAFDRGANDVLRARRGSYCERTLPVPRGRAGGALAAVPALAAWMASAAAFRASGSPRAFELARRAAWAAGWCTATASPPSDDDDEGAGRSEPALQRLALRGRALALRLTPP